ncbi:MAG: ATPase, T2SS/T4P/T4SS family, partial [Bacillota bacterium]
MSVKRRQKTRDFLGRRLVEAGVITEEQLEQALQRQNVRGHERGLLGKILVHLGFCSEADIAAVVAEQAGVSLVTLEDYPVDAAATATVSPSDCRRYNVLPIGFNDDDRLIVAMKHPGDILALDDLRILTGFEIEPVVAVDSELDLFIKRYAHDSMSVEHEEEEEEEEPSLSEVSAGDTEAAERPAVQLANVIITQAVAAKASDVHIEVYEKSLRIRFRIDGVLHDVMHPPRRMHASLVSRIKVMANLDIAERRVPQDGRMTLRIEDKTIDVRVASLPASFGERLTLRLLDRSARMITLEELGGSADMLKKYRETIVLPYGFILVTGPTGSGKSTTL